jgi:hypothetical protein
VSALNRELKVFVGAEIYKNRVNTRRPNCYLHTGENVTPDIDTAIESGRGELIRVLFATIQESVFWIAAARRALTQR